MTKPQTTNDHHWFHRFPTSRQEFCSVCHRYKTPYTEAHTCEELQSANEGLSDELSSNRVQWGPDQINGGRIMPKPETTPHPTFMGGFYLGVAVGFGLLALVQFFCWGVPL